MKEKLAAWLDDHEKAVVIASTVTATMVLMGIGACIGMKYCEHTFNEMLRRNYMAGYLKAFNEAGEEISCNNRGYFYKILP